MPHCPGYWAGPFQCARLCQPHTELSAVDWPDFLPLVPSFFLAGVIEFQPWGNSPVLCLLALLEAELHRQLGRGAVGILWSQSHTPGPAPACVAVSACGCCMFGLGLGCWTAPLPVLSGKIKIRYTYALYCIFCEGRDWEQRTNQVALPHTPSS